MKLSEISLSNSLNAAYRKVKASRTQIDLFKKNMSKLYAQIEMNESEEYHKNIISDFLKETYYSPNHYMNTKGRTDLVIHNGKDAKSTVGVLIETKKPSNMAEMPTKENVNVKAFHELLLYYLRERITNNNVGVKHLIVSNIYEWFIFDAKDFESQFVNNVSFIKQFTDFEERRLSGHTTDFYYKSILEPFIDQLDTEFSFTYLNLRDYENILVNKSKQDEKNLVALYKIFSPEHLLKLPFTNDSNSLDRGFYNELLHIIGLKEIKKGTKKLIGRNPEKERNAGSLIENAIAILRYEDCLLQVNVSDYGNDKEEQLYNVALELIITWINRILFLKLLEGQLVKYHSGDKSFKFFDYERLPDFDVLNKLFFQVLAVKKTERSNGVKQIFGNIPYLNSSLFEPDVLEHKTIRISNLEDGLDIPILKKTVLKNQTGKRIQGKLNTLQYIFEFLDAYDFASEGSEEIQEENKTLISASVLGLIFEKINGYKEGAFFTPGFITMYMCRETIQRAVINKFNDFNNWQCETLDDVFDKIEDKHEANMIINSLKICDPAVGSGHFLVSALNEIIAIKSDLKILLDRAGRTLRDYQVQLVNDEIVITDDDGQLFEYKPANKESHRIQEALFHEKQTIIENCLFGVDVNPNSVKICRLRLWIELLKNSYYNANNELETLPNIDINIKCGNSLISRFTLDTNIKKSLKKSDWSIDSYREAIMAYRNAQSKDEKHAMEVLIDEIKNDFEIEIVSNDKRLVKMNELKGQLYTHKNQQNLFDLSKTEKAERKNEEKKLKQNISNLEFELEEIRNSKIYNNAFEWRLEFPEVLNDDGDFVGFDVVIGNPPYVYRKSDLKLFKSYYTANYFNTSGNFDLYKFFIEKAIQISKSNGINSFITNSSFLLQSSFEKTRAFFLSHTRLKILAPLGPNVFEEATVDSVVYIAQKAKNENSNIETVVPDLPRNISSTVPYFISQDRFQSNDSLAFDCLLNEQEYPIVQKLLNTFPNIESGYEFGVGINTGYIKSQLTENKKIDDRYHPMIRGTGLKRYGVPDSIFGNVFNNFCTIGYSCSFNKQSKASESLD